MRMFKSIIKVRGVTVQEVLLVVAIGAVITVIGLRLNNMLRRQSNVATVQSNVNTLFQAAASFYYANCRRQIDIETGPVAGTGLLDPTDDGTSPVAPPNPYPVTSVLGPQNFLKTALFSDPIIADYVVQYNQVTPAPDRVVQTPTGPVNVGQIIMWRIQVSGQLRPQFVANARQYLALLGGNCLARAKTPTTITPCSEVGAVPVGGTIYVVWERMPSNAVLSSQTGQMLNNARYKMNTQLYTTYSQQYLMSLPASSYPAQNYLCGS